MPQFGTIQRQYPRLEVLRGFNPNEPHTFTQAYPVASGVTILSGQVVYAAWDAGLSQYEWNLGWVAGAVPFFALNDSADPDVVETGNLVALSAAGQFELQTPFADGLNGLGGGTPTYNVDVPLSPDGVTGNLTVATLGNSVPIVGFVTRNHGPLSLVGINSNVVNTNVISFQCAYSLNRS